MTAPDDPRAARLLELVEKWREQAAAIVANTQGLTQPVSLTDFFANRVGTFNECADELLAALSGSSAATQSTYKQWMGLSENIIVVPETTTKKEIMREGEHIMASTHIPTASPNESQSQDAPHRHLTERARALRAKVGCPSAQSWEGPPNPEHETYSLCNGDVADPEQDHEDHSCYATVVARDMKSAYRVAEEIAEAFAIVAAVAEIGEPRHESKG